MGSPWFAELCLWKSPGKLGGGGADGSMVLLGDWLLPAGYDNEQKQGWQSQKDRRKSPQLLAEKHGSVLFHSSASMEEKNKSIS